MQPSALLLLAPALLASAAPLSSSSITSLPYAVPAQLLQELGLMMSSSASSNKLAAADAVDTASSSSSSSSSSSASCTLPPNFTISHFTTWAPAGNATNTTAASNSTTTTLAPYVAFRFADAATGIDTTCARNASSVSLNDARAATTEATAVTGLAARYACDDPGVAFVWQPAHTAVAPGGSLTLIETVCAGRTATVYEVAGTLRPPAAQLQCVAKRGVARSSAHAVVRAPPVRRAAGSPFRSQLGAAGAGTLCWVDGSLAANYTSLQPSPFQ